MYRSLMVPLDSSAFGEYALPLALSIARRAGASIQFVHVCEPPRPTYFTDGMSVRDEPQGMLEPERASAYLTQLARCLSARWEIPITTAILEGPAADTLRAHALETGADLMVLTTHARGPLSRIWLGSVADALVRWLPIPILLVRPHEEALDLLEEVHEQAFQHVLIPLDGSALAEEILEPAIALGTIMRAEYTLLQAIDLPVIRYAPALQATGMDEQAREQWRAEAQTYLNHVAERLRAQGLQVRTQIIDAPPATAILAYARQHAADLIAMSTHGRGGFIRMVLGSVTEAVLRGGTMPVLLYRPYAAAANSATHMAPAAQTIDLEE